MTDSFTAKTRTVPGEKGEDVVRLEGIEWWYRERCRPVSEICVVPFEAGLHAVLIPDFAWLREHKRPNSRELIRFEFHQASLGLPCSDRPSSFSVRTKAFPLEPDGHLNREELRSELLDFRPTQPATIVAEPIAERVRECIRMYRPEIFAPLDANLELDLGFDSLDRILLLTSVQESFGVVIPDDEAAMLLTVSDLIKAIATSVRRSLPGASVSWSGLLSCPLDPAEQSIGDSLFRSRPAFTSLAWGFARILRLLFARRMRFEVTGLENLPSSGAWLLAPNHCSHLDPLLLLWALPWRIAKNLSFMGHTEYFGSGWKAALAKRLKLVPVDPDEHARRGLRLAAEALRRGLIGAVFPEGERSPNGAQQRFHRGIAVLARELSVPIVPTAICGTYEVFPRGRDRMIAAPVQVRFGEPVYTKPDENQTDLLARLWTAVSQLRGSDAYARTPMPLPMDILPSRFG